MARTVAAVVLLLLWVGFFVIYTIVYLVVVELLMCYTSVLQETPRCYLWMGAGMLLWWSVGLLFPGSPSFYFGQWRPALGVVAVAVLNGGLAGRLMLDLVNNFNDSSPGEPVRFEVKGGGHTSVVIRLIDPYPGVRFTVSGSTMSRASKDPSRHFVVHRGRLGLLWGEFQ